MAFWNKSNKKSVNLSITDLDKLMDLAISNGKADAYGSAYYKGVLKKIASTVRIVPRRIVTDTGIEVPEKDLPFDINLNNLLGQSSIAVNRFGRAYYGLDTQGSSIAAVRWFNPSSITEDYHHGRFVGFTRTNENDRIFYRYNPDTKRADFGDSGGLAWVWSLGMNEIGPGDTLDDDVALPASLLQFADKMMEVLFKRGGVKKMIAIAENEPNADDKKRIKSALARVLTNGVQSTGSIEVISSLLKLEEFGITPSELGMEEVNRGNKSDVSAAALTPQMLIDPSLASNRSVIDRVTASWLNEFLVPHAELITDAMNHHIFTPSGLRVELLPNAMGADQQDEVDRAQAWRLYVDGGMEPETATAMLGLDVPEDMPLMALTPLPQETPGQSPATVGGMMQLAATTEKSAEWENERRQFKAWYKGKGVGADVSNFAAYHLRDDDKAVVIGEILESDLWEVY